MATEEEWFGRGVLQAELLRLGPQFGHAGMHLARLGRASELVRDHDQAQFFNGGGGEGIGEAAHGARAAHLQMREVMLDQRGHPFFDLIGGINAREEGFGEGTALFLVAGGDDPQASVALGLMGGLRLGKVVGQHGKHQDPAGGGIGGAPLGQFRERVATVAGVGENIAFGMPSGILRRAIQGGDFGKMLQPAGGFQELQSGRGALPRERPFEPFHAHALDRQFGKRGGNRAAQDHGFRGGHKMEPGGKLHAPQHAQGVLHESRTGVAQDAPGQIVLAAEEIEVFAGARIEHERVDGEIAAAGGGARLDAGVERHLKAFVAGGQFGIAAGQAEIPLAAAAAGKLDHAERFADQIHAAIGTQRPRQGFVVHPIDFEVKILVGDA